MSRLALLNHKKAPKLEVLCASKTLPHPEEGTFSSAETTPGCVNSVTVSPFEGHVGEARWRKSVKVCSCPLNAHNASNLTRTLQEQVRGFFSEKSDHLYLKKNTQKVTLIGHPAKKKKRKKES